jgi:AraC family transcriptional regulator of adaptative response / DNA-3-methyladenine glycosylase II
MPGARRAALAELARRVASGALDLGPGRPAEEITADLIEVPGIGPWTASYVALRALGDRDAFPARDLGLQRAARALGLPGDAARLAAHAERWRPWRAHAAHLLWASANPSRMRDAGTGNQGRTE